MSREREERGREERERENKRERKKRERERECVSLQLASLVLQQMGFDSPVGRHRGQKDIFLCNSESEEENF